MFSCDTGGVLNRVVHFYHYNDFDHRDAHRAAAAASREWQEGYLAHSRPCCSQQDSNIFLPAAGVLAAAGAAPIQQYTAPGRQPGTVPIYELRQYQVRAARMWSFGVGIGSRSAAGRCAFGGRAGAATASAGAAATRAT